ncbi:hypothetical protein [Siccirubricoccus phaeus]|uniref:hypothetical protein n=1 Tax=Siccirubricoccus phaeus TaxID=2595053 RepID=UPI0011F30A8D|nr:hypothetical protein [Siccirubricoccus phaeus]
MRAEPHPLRPPPPPPPEWQEEAALEEREIGVIRHPSRVPDHEHETDTREIHTPEGIRQLHGLAMGGPSHGHHA